MDPINYQGNSKKKKDNLDKPDEKKIEKVIKGEVVEKPKGPMAKMREIVGSDFKTAAIFVIQDVFWPAVRDLGFNMVVEGARQSFYKEGDPRRRSSGFRDQGPRVRYDRSPMRPDSYRDRERFLPDQPRYARPRREFNEQLFMSRSDAEVVLEGLDAIIDQYEVASLADYYDLIGKTDLASHMDNKWGWTRLGSVNIRQVADGYVLELPRLQEIS